MCSAERDADVYIGTNWVLSSALAKAFVQARRTALIIDNKIVGVTDVQFEMAKRILGQSAEAALSAGLSLKAPDELADSYNKTLRKTDPPYGIDISAAPVEPVMRRQFASSYKGITDFVTKYFWPLPAYYVTRLCARLRLTPNMVTTIGLFLCIVAFYYFMNGHGRWGL